MTTKPVKPITTKRGEIVLRASFSVRSLNLQNIQKPASFIHGTNLDPQPIANPIYTGLNAKLACPAIPDKIPEAVISATVAEPCAVRTTAAIKMPWELMPFGTRQSIQLF